MPLFLMLQMPSLALLSVQAYLSFCEGAGSLSLSQIRVARGIFLN